MVAAVWPAVGMPQSPDPTSAQADTNEHEVLDALAELTEAHGPREAARLLFAVQVEAPAAGVPASRVPVRSRSLLSRSLLSRWWSR